MNEDVQFFGMSTCTPTTTCGLSHAERLQSKPLMLQFISSSNVVQKISEFSSFVEAVTSDDGKSNSFVKFSRVFNSIRFYDCSTLMLV